MSEPQELEKTAMSYITNAVEFEKQGDTTKAISFYQKAIDGLNKLIERYPDHRFTKIYRDRADVYQEHILILQASAPKAETQNETPSTFKESVMSETKPEITEPQVDLVPILLEINRKLDELTASISQLKDDVLNLKVNANDATAKTELTQKEMGEIKSLLYTIKYER
jgi:hypothetical protein